MTSTFTPAKNYQLQGTGDNPGSWGVLLNAVLSMIDLNLGGTLALNVAGNSNITLSASQQQNGYILMTGVLTGSIQVIFTASAGGLFWLDNQATGAFTITAIPAGGTGVVVPQGGRSLVVIDGTNNRARIVSTPNMMTTTGDMLYQDANGAQRLAVGAAGTVIGGGTVPAWFAAKPKAVVSLVDGATPALNAALGDIFLLTSTQNPTIAVPSNPVSGQAIIIAFTASGSARTLALNTGAGGFHFGTDITALTQTTSAATDYIGCVYNLANNHWDLVAYVRGF